MKEIEITPEKRISEVYFLASLLLRDHVLKLKGFYPVKYVLAIQQTLKDC